MSDITAAPRPSARTDLAVGLIILAGWAALAAATYIGQWAPDLSALYFAARFYGLGMLDQVYASPALFFGSDHAPGWTRMAAELGYPDEEFFPFVYPPIWAALFAPIATRTDPVAFYSGVYVVQIALLAAAPVLAYRILRPAMPFRLWALVSAGLLLSAIFAYHSLYHNQPQITVAFLVLLAFERLAHGRQIAAGTALGLAAAIKLSPLLLVLVFLAERKYRATAAFVLVSGGLALASFAVAGPDLHRVFLDKLAVITGQIAIWNFNYSLKPAMFQLYEVAAGRGIPTTESIFTQITRPPAWIGVLMPALLIAGAAGILHTTRRLPERERLMRRLAAWFLWATLCAPLSWAHHFLVVLFFLPALPVLIPGRLGWGLLALFALVFSAPVTTALPGVTLGLNWCAVIGTAFLTVLTAVFAASGRAGARAAAPAPPPAS